MSAPATSAHNDAASARHALATTSPARASQLADAKLKLRAALRQFSDFPIPGIEFVDILPLFADPALHALLLDCLEAEVLDSLSGGQRPDVVVGLDARGFLFGPSLALRLGAAFVPVRKQGKLPGPCEKAGYEKEYGTDFFEIQADGVKAGQKVVVVDDIIATGMCDLFRLFFELQRIMSVDRLWQVFSIG